VQINVEPKYKYFVVRITGPVTNGSLREYVSLIMDFAQESGLKRILLDERELSIEADMYEAYLVGESDEIVTAAIEGYRFACVPDPANRSRNEAFETVMRNRSVNYRVFDSVRVAERWLLS